MLRLHDFAFSNYHNLVKVVLLEKGVDFEEVTGYPPADDSFLSKNPTGKFPCLELEDGASSANPRSSSTTSKRSTRGSPSCLRIRCDGTRQRADGRHRLLPRAAGSPSVR